MYGISVSGCSFSDDGLVSWTPATGTVEWPEIIAKQEPKVPRRLRAQNSLYSALPEPQKLLRGDQTLKIEPRMLIPPNVETRELWWSFVVQLRVLQVLVAMFYTAALSFKRSLVTPITSRPAVPSGSCFLKHDRGLCVWRALCTQILLYRLRTFQA
jgi:hypothetical protein